jgi:hypothetical protein
MEDKDIKKYFEALKKSENTATPDFDLLLQRPRPVLKKSSPIRRILTWTAAAASVALIALATVWSLNNSSGDQLAEEIITEEKNIMNWESETDVLLPVEHNKGETFAYNSLEAPITAKKPVLKEEVKNLLKEVPELKAEDYKYGALSDWESPTSDLMPFYRGMSFMGE